MIDKTLSFILDRLDAALQQQYPSAERHAVLAELNEDNLATVENKIILSIANIERETGTQALATLRPDATGYSKSYPALNLNLVILVAANFGDNYVEGLKFLSAALAFFQSSLVLTPNTSPNFPASMEKLTIEFVNVSLQELNSLWSIRSWNYLPSFLLRLRTVPIVKGDIRSHVPAVTSVDVGQTKR